MIILIAVLAKLEELEYPVRGTLEIGKMLNIEKAKDAKDKYQVTKTWCLIDLFYFIFEDSIWQFYFWLVNLVLIQL